MKNGRRFQSVRSTGLDPTRPAGLSDRLLELSDHVTPNAVEAAQIAGTGVAPVADAERAARRIRELGPRHVHVRLPRGGCYSASLQGEVLVLAPPTLKSSIRPEPETASQARSRARSPRATRSWRPSAFAAATCAVTAFGAQESYPDRLALAAMARRVQIAPGSPARSRVSNR
jgi:ribokinase